MDDDLKAKLLATKSVKEFASYYEQYTGEMFKQLGQIMEGEGGSVLEHFLTLMQEERKDTPFAPHKLPDGREIFISPYIRDSDKKSR